MALFEIVRNFDSCEQHQRHLWSTDFYINFTIFIHQFYIKFIRLAFIILQCTPMYHINDLKFVLKKSATWYTNYYNFSLILLLSKKKEQISKFPKHRCHIERDISSFSNKVLFIKKCTGIILNTNVTPCLTPSVRIHIVFKYASFERNSSFWNYFHFYGNETKAIFHSYLFLNLKHKIYLWKDEKIFLSSTS